MKYYCNPVNIDYRYQFLANVQTGEVDQIGREAADPSMIFFNGRYYIFASMQLSVWVSDDLVHWESRRLPDDLPLYDYAPDVCRVGDYVYVCASRRDEICDFYRTKDILNGPYEKLPGSFDFWDPHMFCDDDGRVYFYWGCSNVTPIWGVELDTETMLPKSERQVLISGDPFNRGYERNGDDHCLAPRTDEEAEAMFQAALKARGMTEDMLPEGLRATARGIFTNRPYIEGPWMNKHNGRYYLQYASPGTQYNVYNDGVYEGPTPLGPFTPAKNNPYSYKPGGFMTGSGHGSTAYDRNGQLWHVSTMQISKNFNFERRVGLWKAGFDADGELFCDQRYGDWPAAADSGEPFCDPDWYLLSYGKPVTASSFEEGREPALAADENAMTWWRAACAGPGEWILLDLEKCMDIRAIQINFADEGIDVATPGELRPTSQPRYIDENTGRTRWLLEASCDGMAWTVIADKTQADTDLPHDFLVFEDGISFRYLKLTVTEVPYGQNPCISGLRVFGKGDGKSPASPAFTADRTSPMDMTVTMEAEGATGFNILWGSSPDKLYHSCMVFGKNTCSIGALVNGQSYAVRVDAFNENGITHAGSCLYV